MIRTYALILSFFPLLLSCGRDASDGDVAPSAPSAEGAGKPGASAAVPAALIGRFVEDPAWCPLSRDEAVEIKHGFITTPTRTLNWETHCDITDVATVEPDRHWLLSRACDSEGLTFTVQTNYQLTEQGVRIWTPGISPAGLTRCPETPASWWTSEE